jgi:hypothetical protein
MPRLKTAPAAAGAFSCLACLAALAAAVLAADDDDTPQTYRQIVAKRATPKLEDLAQRSSPEQTGQIATESFWDLLKLRDEPAAAAVPELVRVLAANDGTNRIHAFAAAQALFAADTDEARRALDAHLLVPEYRVDLAAMYASHWQMAEPLRSRFIDAYILRNLSKDLEITVEAVWRKMDATSGSVGNDSNRSQAEPAQNLVVNVKLANRSKRTLAINAGQPYQAMSLFFRNPSGAYWRPMQLVVYQPPPPHWLRLQPGDSTSYVVTLELKTDAESLAKAKRLYTDNGNAAALLTTSDVGAAVPEFGKYKLSAMIAAPPLVEEQQKSLREREGIDPSEVWTGRAVSAPLEIELRSPSQQDK